jgi:hypothetical protein
MVLIEAEQKMRTLNSMKEDLNVINCLQAHLRYNFSLMLKTTVLLSSLCVCLKLISNKCIKEQFSFAVVHDSLIPLACERMAIKSSSCLRSLYVPDLFVKGV